MNILTKLQNLPIKTKKVILWLIVAVLALFLFSWWIENVKERIGRIQKQEVLEEMKIPELKKEIKNAPRFRISDFFSNHKQGQKSN